MARLLIVLAFVSVAVTVYAVVDVLSIHEWRVKSLNKAVWVLIILVLPLLGAILWFLVGKGRGDDAAAAARRDSRRPVAPDDDPLFLHNANRFDEQEARIRQLEEQLRKLDDDDDRKG